MVRVLRMMGKNAGNLPGLALWTLNKKCLKAFRPDCPIIAVTGTNGKTSVTNFLSYIFSKSGCKNIITNYEGNNLDTGICSLLLNYCTMTGKIHADYLVLEVDESHVPVIFSQLKLETLIVLNFFRDQLDRNGEVETLILKVKKFCETFDGNLILNGDDPNVARLGLANPGNKKVKYFSVERYKYATETLYEAGEGRFCPVCGHALEYDYYQYSHIGKFRCPKCGYGNYPVYARFTGIDPDKRTFTADGGKYTTVCSSIYYMYNLCAVYSAAKLYGIDKEIIRKAFRSFRVNNGRLESFRYKNSELILNLAKNPVGANMTVRIMNECPGKKELLFVLNDNTADGLDVSWIWDINFSIFNNVSKVVASGTRAYDIAVRIKCSGYDASKIKVRPDLDDAVKELFSGEGKKFAIANYTAVQPARAALNRFIGGVRDEK
ncbi:MurT ligase domain-containing protein [Ruminococcus sp. Marseille-P6503]|uniref:MurT ligase domain-containing protein n=1 Tax=Ruminococcus sp. Marseille-P6503 TaxID=2364796 RepID=UPI001FAB3413|nr:MurT ligase domain-containing protein [Ruminococcus sp. Marseille-P6503]